MMFACIVRLALFVAFESLALPALAAPAVYFNPATGGIWMKSDYTASAFGFGTLSGSAVTIPDPSLFRTVPGAVFDPEDLPLGFTYLKFPATEGKFGLFIGNVILPGTPVTDLGGIYILGVGPDVRVDVSVIPEPTTAAISVIAGVGMASLTRRFSSRPANSG